MKNTNILLKAALSIAVLIIFGSLAQENRAATFTVNSPLDIQDANPGNGVCQTATAGQCTLRAAITEANALAGNDVITLPAGIYTVTLSLPPANENANASGDFDITSNVTINGAGASSTFIQAASSPNSTIECVLNFLSGTSTVSGITVRYGGGANGGGNGVLIDSSANVTLNSVTVSDNTGKDGGGVSVTSSNASLTMNNS